MKVVHIESGLGNQMLSYCEYLAIKKMNPNDDCYIETIIYELPECNDIICQWNGYELNNIFGLDAPNIKDHFNKETWERIIKEIRTTEFWLHNWNYPVYFTNAFRHAGIDLINMRGDFEAPGATYMTMHSTPRYKRTFLFQYANFIRKKYFHRPPKTIVQPNDLFIETDKDIFTGQRLTFKYVGSGIERIEKEIKELFTFPPYVDERNALAHKEIASSQSVGIHARRGDMLSYNFDCYYGGYFKRAIKYIKEKVPSPIFYIFCDPGSVEWAKEHGSTFGLDFHRDIVKFVDWNKGNDSWRDMQLLSACKHQVITRSSFGWWGAYLNSNPDKITCSPDPIINTTHHF